MSDHDDEIPTIGTHRGVGIHDQQSPERIEHVVKPEIDRVFLMANPRELMTFVGDPRNSPEARLLAGAKYEAAHEQAVEDRAGRAGFDLATLHARIAGVGSRTWRDKLYFCSMLDRGSGSTTAVLRDQPLAKD